MLKLLDTALSQGQVALGPTRVDLLGNALLTDFALYRDDGSVVLSVDRVALRFVPSALLTRELRVVDLRVEGVYADVLVDEDGVLELTRMFGGPSDTAEPWGGLPIDLDFEHLALEGAELRYRTPDGTVAQLRELHATATLQGSGKRIAVGDLHVDAEVVEPGPLPVSLGGSLVYDDGSMSFEKVSLQAPGTQLELEGSAREEMNLEVRAVQADLARLDPLLGGAGLTGTLNASMRLIGPPEDLRLVAVVEGTGATEGTARLRLAANTSAPRLYWNATGELDDLHVEHLLATLDDPIVLSGDLNLRGSGTGWPDDLTVTGRWEGNEQQVMGQPLSSVDLAFHIGDGIVYVDDTSVVEGLVGTVYPDGWYDLQSGLLDVNASGDLTPTALAALGVEGLQRPGTYDVRLIGATGGEVPLHVKGTARFDRGFQYSEVKADQLRAHFGIDLLDGRVTGQVDLDGSQIDAYGLTAAALVGPGLQFDVADGHTTLLGHLTLAQVAYDPVLTTQQLEVSLSVDAGEDLRTEADLVFGPYAVAEQPGTGGSGRVKLVGGLLDFQVELQDGDREELELLGRYRTQDATVDLAALGWSPTPRIAWHLARPAHLRVSEEGGVEDTDIHWTSGLGDVKVRGVLGAAGPLDGELIVDGLQLDMFAELFPEQADGLSGAASAEVRLGGQADAPDVQVGFEVADLYLEDTVRYLDIEGTAHWKDDQLHPTASVAVADVPLLEVSGQLPLSGPFAAPRVDPDGFADLTIDVRPGDYQRFADASPSLDPDTLPSGVVSASVDVQGPWRAPVLHTAGVSEVTITGWKEPGRVEFDARYDAGALSFWSDLREGFAQRANLGGGGLSGIGEVWSWAVLGAEKPDLEDPTLWLDQMFVSGVLLGVPVRSLVAMSDLGVVAEGELVGGVSVTGDPNEPVVEGGVHVLDLRLGDTLFDGAYAELVPADPGYDLTMQLDFPPPKLPAEATTPPPSKLVVSGPVPVVIDTRREVSDWTVSDLDLTVEGDALPLSLLQVANPDIRKAVGQLTMKGHVGGTLTDPAPTLELVMDGGSLQYAPQALSATDIAVKLALDKEKVSLETFTCRLEPRRKFRTGSAVTDVGLEPRIRASGEANLDDWNPTGVAIGVKLADGAWLSATDDMQIRADGSLAVSGTWPALRVGGDLEAVLAHIALDAASFLDTAPLELDPRISIVRDERATERAEVVEEPPLYADFLVDVDVDLKRNLEVDVSMPFIDDFGSLGAAVTRADVSSRLGGDLQAKMVDGDLDLIGEVEVIEGKVRVLRSSFTLQEGTVSFTGGDPFNPVLDLGATMALSDASVNMSIHGTPESPEIRFTSEEYPDQTQIMTILLTGRAPDELNSSQGEGTAQALAQLLLNSVFAGQSLGSFSIEPDGSVRLGVPISQSVYASSTLAPTQNPAENRLSVGLEWSVLPKVVVSGAVGDRRSSADVYWEIRF